MGTCKIWDTSDEFIRFFSVRQRSRSTVSTSARKKFFLFVILGVESHSKGVYVLNSDKKSWQDLRMIS
jgi:hypothetical protein